MKGRASTLLPPILAAATIVALTLYAYRELPARPFAADDYQWLLNVRGLSFSQLARQAFDPSAQSHFYRPLVWLLFWAQVRAFGLDPRGFHAISIGLHLLNAGLLGWLAYRLTKDQGPRTKEERIADQGPRTKEERTASWSLVFGLSSALAAAAIVALHPAPFEAVVWASAQSELLAAALLLIALLLWTMDDGRWTMNDGHRHSIGYRLSSIVGGWRVPLATLALGLALLAKESAVIGLPLLFLLGQHPHVRRQEAGGRSPTSSIKHQASNITPYIPPILLTLAYVALQAAIERRNYLLEQGGYGFGPQLLLNPLRSLALIVAPLPGTEHADAAWLVPVGAVVALVLLGCWMLDVGCWRRLPQSNIQHPTSPMVLALALTLLPTAPFVSPPDSRYLYLPVMAAALLITLEADKRRKTKDKSHDTAELFRPSSFVLRRIVVLCSLFFVLALAYWASGELHEREWRFAAGSGPGGSLWRLASAVCADSRPDRMVLVEPPLAPPHVEAIVGLSCGDHTRTRIVGRDQVDGAIKGHTVVIAFPNGSAAVERRT